MQYHDAAMAPELHEGLGHVLNDGEARSSSEWIPASQNQSVLLHGWNGVFRKAASQVCRMRTSSRRRHQASILCRRCTGMSQLHTLSRVNCALPLVRYFVWCLLPVTKRVFRLCMAYEVVVCYFLTVREVSRRWTLPK